MLRPVIFFILTFLFIQSVSGQKEYINRKIAQKNYDAYMLMLDEKYDSALIILNEAISGDPEAFFIYQNRAICKLNLNDTTGAIADFKMNLKLEPGNTETKYALGNIYKSLKGYDLTAKHYFI